MEAHERAQLEIQQAGNVAWNTRVNGLHVITPENVVFMARVMERMAERERYVQLLLQQLAALPRRTQESKAMGSVLQAAELVTFP